ncbi:MAG: hypothetical protein Q4P08_04325 [Eubacteriales bacterium]|nr:hypothetical protein [Eubacteriales bacterium]
MQSKTPKYLILICQILVLITLLSACSLFKKSKGNDAIDDEVANIVQEDPDADLKKNERGLSRREEDFLKFGEDKLANLIAAFNEFGKGTESYQSDVINKGIEVSKNKRFIETRDKLYEACTKIEAIPLSTVPESMRNFFEQNFRLANHCRLMAHSIQSENATNLPDAYNQVLTELNNYATQAQEFIAKIQDSGVELAQSIIPPVNWTEEEANRPSLTSTFDVAELGLYFGASRAEVMGVEGLVKDYDKLEKLEYDHTVYVYHGVRKYFFNEFDQLYKVSYLFRPNHQNPYHDLRDLFFPVHHSFQVPDYFDLNPDMFIQESSQPGEYFFSIDMPHLTAVIKSTSDHPEIPVSIDVTAKLADNGAAAEQE